MADRVTTSMIYGSLMGPLQNNLQNLLDLQRQLATQNKYSKLSDNPADIARALGIESSIISSEQFISNQTDAISMLKHADAALDSALNILQTIRAKVIYAGDGALDATAVAAIADEIDALKDQLLDTLNTKVAGKYLFGGADTTTKPFVMDKSGNIRYVGSDERIRYEIEHGLFGDVSFAGSEVMPNSYKSYFVCSHYVPMDWQWTGREEKVQITVGGRTLSIFIPEQWIDEVATGETKPTDYNEFRDPGELNGISLDDVAALVNRALKEQGADMLVTATVEKNYDIGLQRLVFKSNTGESISVTGWPDTDYLPMPQSVAGLTMDTANLPDWNATMLTGNAAAKFDDLDGKSLVIQTASDGTITVNFPSPASFTSLDDVIAYLNSNDLSGTSLTATAQGDKLALVSANGETIRVDNTSTAAADLFGTSTVSETPKYSGLMGTTNTLGWKGDGMGKEIEITAGGVTKTFLLDDYRSISDLVADINARMPVGAGELPFASIESGRLVLQSAMGDVTVSDSGSAGGTKQLFGYGGPLKSSTSSLTVRLGENQPVKIYINEGDTLKDIAERINAIEGIYARTSADGDQLVVVAQRTGNSPSDPLAVDAAKEKTHYPSFTVWGEGMAMSLFDFAYASDPETGVQAGTLGSKEQTRQVDHSHIDLFDYLGMETSLKSREYEVGETIKITEPLHWRIVSGSRVTEIKLNPGEYTMEQLAERLKNAGAGWLEVTVDVFRQPGAGGADDTENGLGTSYNGEKATGRLVIRSKEGSPVAILDMNGQRYAEEMGLSTAIRVDDDMGVDKIVFPTAPCVDDNIAAMMRVQMTCGKSYDIRLTRKDVVDPTTGEVDRVKVMEQMAKQVNAQAGEEVLRVVYNVDQNGKPIAGSASLIAVTGEPFSVVDLPVSDPLWKDYTGGLAAQMGIHTGITSKPISNGTYLKDNDKLGVSGTIRFESLGQSVEIDVFENDTVKDVMDRLRSEAGDWLYVNYFDAAMGNAAGQEGNEPIISIAAKDGSAINVIDVKGTVAQDKLALSTGIQGDVQLYDSATDAYSWSTTEGAVPAQVFSITVAGYTHTIDLTAMRDVNGNGILDAQDLVETINARMQDYDVRAELNEDGCLVLWSPRGYSIEVSASEVDADGNPTNDITSGFLGSAAGTTPYRGGYKLEDPNRTAPGIYTQNVTVRSGSNQTNQNFFGVLDDISAAVRAENRDALSEKMLPLIDKFMDGLLKLMSTGGALQTRYTGNIERLKLNNITMTEVYDSLAKVDLTETTTKLMMAQAIYQASLSVIAQIVQPTLLNFLN